MKALIALLTVALLGGGGYYVFFALPDAEKDTPPVTPDATPDAGTKPGGQQPAELEAPPAEQVSTKKDTEPDEQAKRRELWTKLRPSAERLIPDPDGIGPCPPVDLGGRPAPVVQRYRDPGNGFAVWVHDDGSYTYLHSSGGGIDPKTGEPIPAGEMVTTLVPTEPLPITPDELPDQGGGEEGSGSNRRRNG